MEKFYLTTAIDYVNGAPHIGHAYEKILTDIIARHYSQRCDDVFFLTGTDEHGIKIQKTAAEKGITPKELCDINAQSFKDAWKALDIDYTRFIRTTDEDHEAIVQKIFKKLVEQGDIYKHKYEGLYCSGCECFLNEKDLTEDGLCPDHLKKPEIVSEENYFFKLTKYKDAIINHIKNNPSFIIPSFRANEVLNQLENIERKISVAYENRNEADKQADQAKKKAAQYEKELTEIAPMVKEMERFAEKYSADPEEVLPEAGTLETGKSYREKKAKPLIKKIVTVLRSVYRAYLDLSIKFSDMQRSYERAWDKVNSLTVRVDELWNENRTLKERMGDFYLVERALGRDTVETIVLREKRLEEEQRVQRRKQKRKMDRDAR